MSAEVSQKKVGVQNEKRAVIEAWKIDTFRDSYFWRILPLRGLTFREIKEKNAFDTANLGVSCYSCVREKCKLRKYNYQQQLTLNDVFFTCTSLLFAKPTEADWTAYQEKKLQQEASEKTAEIEQLHAYIRDWLSKDPENVLKYAEAICKEKR